MAQCRRNRFEAGELAMASAHLDVGAFRAIVFDLGGTLVDWPDWETAWEERWGLALVYCRERVAREWPDAPAFSRAMHEAELAHWRRVEEQYLSAPPDAVVREGFALLGRTVDEFDIEVTLDGYARAVNGWACGYPDARQTLLAVRQRGLSIGLLSNTWWAASWHNADLAEHGLDDLIDVAVYTSQLPHSKPHPEVFRHVLAKLRVSPEQSVMVGDRPIDDIRGALGVGMTAVFKTNGHPRPVPAGVHPSATIQTLSELLPALDRLAAGR
jgi:putative hydrolase of the HAD superfamily